MNALCVFIIITLLDPVSACTDGNCRIIEFPSYLCIVGKRLINHLIKTIPGMDQDSCEWQCYLDNNCVSINLQFEGTERNCELSNSTHNEHHEDFIGAEGYFYRGTENACGGSPCKNNAICQSGFTSKRYRCLCISGYTGHDCGEDVDECSQVNECSEHACCHNTAGSYYCKCREGYYGDGYTCEKLEFSIESTILSGNKYYRSHLYGFLVPAVGNVSHWSLCFRTSPRNIADATFHKKCDGKNDTITIIRVNDYVFGGYIDIPWFSGQPKDPEEYGKTFNAFIFSLSNSQQTRAFKSMIRNSENATSNHIYLGPTFGNNDIRIDRYPNQPTDYTSSVTNFGNDYFLPSNITIQDPQTILAGVKNFRPDELEVFYLNKGSCRQAKASPP